MPIHYEGEIQIRKVVVGPYENNAFVVICPQTKESVIIDTPAEPEKVLAEAEGTHVKGILMTHTHADHTAGHQEIKSKTGAPVAVHPLAAKKLPEPPEILYDHGDTFKFGNITLQVIHTPGHTPEGISLLTGRHLFVGDSLFPGGLGHTPSPQAFKQLLKSITERLYPFPDETFVYPGHGSDTTIGKSKEEYAIFSQRPHPPDLHGHVQWLTG